MAGYLNVGFGGSVRASDWERERAVAALRRHYAAGRLSTEELERRVVAAYAAGWRSELRHLLRDMPFELPVDRSRVSRGVDRFQRGLFRLHFACFTTFNTALMGMWAWGGGHEFWPAFSLIPGGALLAWHRKGSRAVTRRLTGGERRRRRALVA